MSFGFSFDGSDILHRLHVRTHTGVYHENVFIADPPGYSDRGFRVKMGIKSIADYRGYYTFNVNYPRN